jgi:Phosphotransferase enzyme family
VAPAPPDSGRLTGDVLSWLVRQACGEEVATYQRDRGSGRAREADGGGRPTAEHALPEMSAGQRRSAARSCGQVIARLHSVPVGGFYRRHADGSFEFADNAALQAADLANRLDNLRWLAEAGLLTRAEAHRAEGLLPEAVAARGDGPAVLCHGEVDRAALAAGYGPAPFWTDRGRRLALSQLQMLIGYTAHDLRAGKPDDAQSYLAGLKAVLASLAG